MSKAIVRIGYTDYVIDAEKALAIADALADAEVYEDKYHKPEGEVPSYNTYHVYDMDVGRKFDIQVLNNKFYLMCKMAGKPVG